MYAGLLAIAAHDSSRQYWSEIGAIVGGSIALLAFMFGIARWIWEWWRDSEIDHALHISRPGLALTLDQVPIAVSIGVHVKSAATRPLSYQPSRFTLTVNGSVFALDANLPLEDIAPQQEKGWYRAAVLIPDDELPANIEVDYSIHYGRRGKKFKRELDGAYQLLIPRNPQVGVDYFTSESRPTRDRRL